MPRFQVRARAVDMLGRQQIAGIPTAIHELFKNSHDAYAENVSVDFFRADRLLIIRDDGYGMTRADFEDRWLTLGTESKFGANERDTWTGPRDASKRPIMGEKGIGRLAIASIGPQVLVVSRAVRPDRIHPIVVSLVHWGLFELPGIDISEIEIPVVTVDSFSKVDENLIRHLTSGVKQNMETLAEKVTSESLEAAKTELELLNFSPFDIVKLLGGLSLDENSFGTHFFICPTNDILVDDIDGDDDERASPLEKMLLGFSNTMIPEGAKPEILAEFRDHQIDGTVNELISGKQFFTPEEFNAADHHIRGVFDRFGAFCGEVSVYQNPPIEYRLSWPGAQGKETLCGSFSINFAYVQGSSKDSRLPPEEWALLSTKLNRIGGLYVYRDGMRVLPYGNSDYDFLNIERRRTKSASDWFFSYRRILGAVDISHKENRELVEKAGREGFRGNKAYRQFVSILENFFQRVAIDFFRPTSVYGEEFATTRIELNKQVELLRKREKATRASRQKLSKCIENFFDQLEQNAFEKKVEELRDSLSGKLQQLAKVKDRSSLRSELLSLEVEAMSATAWLKDSVSIARPRGFGLTKSLQADWASYEEAAEKLQRELIEPLEQEFRDSITQMSQSKNVELDTRRRFSNLIEEALTAGQQSISSGVREVKGALSELVSTTNSRMEAPSKDFFKTKESVLGSFERTDFEDISETEAQERVRYWLREIDHDSSKQSEDLAGLAEQLTNLTAALNAGESLDSTTAAIEAKADQLTEQLESYTELAQLGMALGIVQHEFVSLVGQIRKSIAKLKPWADATPALKELYQTLLTSFSHLDTYLGLFTPLTRRLNRRRLEISGEQIRRYLLDVFRVRLERDHVALKATGEFDSAIVKTFPSTLFPVFVNLIDNAIYWLTSEDNPNREILLQLRDGDLVIENNGPPISERVASRIFEYGETTKPGGRGIGLYISRRALREEGMDLVLDSFGKSRPAFRICSRAKIE